MEIRTSGSMRGSNGIDSAPPVPLLSTLPRAYPNGSTAWPQVGVGSCPTRFPGFVVVDGERPGDPLTSGQKQEMNEPSWFLGSVIKTRTLDNLFSFWIRGCIMTKLWFSTWDAVNGNKPLGVVFYPMRNLMRQLLSLRMIRHE